MTSIERGKRISRAPKIYSPDDIMDKPSHFLLHFDSTDSYNIALYSSINNITANKATLNIHGRKTIATIITSGTLQFCENEQQKITRLSQQAYDDNSQLEAQNCDENEDDDIYSSSQQEGLVHTYSSLSRQVISNGKRQVRSRSDDESTGSIQDVDDNDKVDAEFGRSDLSSTAFCTKRQLKTNKTKRKKTATSGGTSKRPRTNVVHNEVNQQAIEHTDPLIHNETNSTDRLNQLENHIAIYQNMITKTLKRMEKKFDYHLSPECNQGYKILDQFRSEKGEIFPAVYMYQNKNLLRTPAKDIIDFARRTLRIMFSPEELKSHILPPARDHLRRPALDQERFNILLEAIRIKFRLDSDFMQQCFNDLLRTKLSNFLYEERRRESRRKIRDHESMLKQNMLQPIQYDYQEGFNGQLEETT